MIYCILPWTAYYIGWFVLLAPCAIAWAAICYLVLEKIGWL